VTGGGAQSRWAARLMDGFAASGVREVVVSPGSRTTPLVLAAAAHPELSLVPVVDERAASFFALGLARVTGRPALLVCTSGSAGAHYLPAIVEASLGRVPLVALTADRPPELHARAASQTIDQAHLFGGHVRLFIDLGAAPDDRAALDAAASTAALAVHAARTPTPGPVHLNARLRKPLEPPRAARAEAPGPSPARGWPAVRVADPGAVDALAAALADSRRPLIACGPGPLAQTSLRAAAHELSRLAGAPLLAEATSQLRFTGADDGARCDAFDALLRSAAWIDNRRPDLLVQLGMPPVSNGWQRAARALEGVPLHVASPSGWCDPLGRAQEIVESDLGPLLASVSARLRDLSGAGAPHERRESWRAAWRLASREVLRRFARETDRDDRPLTEPSAVVTVTSELPEDSLLMLGNSLPVREVDAFCPGTLARIGVLHQRGASGIDGQVAGAAGAAAASPADAPGVTLLVGDVGFAHDLGGLACAAGLPVPLVVVVLQNGGGRLFDLLPIGERDDLRPSFERYFLTPPELEVSAAARAYGHRFERAVSARELAAQMREAHASAGCTVIEAVVEPTSAARLQHELWRIADEVATESGAAG